MMKQNKRYYELDALRGIGALLIVVVHLMMCAPNRSPYLSFLSEFGNNFLILFFVLSGFVLTLSMRNRTDKRSITAYWVRRFFRLYPIYIVTALVVYFTKLIWLEGDISTDFVAPFFNIGWRIPVSVPELLNSLTLIGDYNTWALDGPSWTLTFEARLSLLLPLLLLAYKFAPKLSHILLIIGGGIAAYFLYQIPIPKGMHAPDLSFHNLMSNIIFTVFFGAGILYAFQEKHLTVWFQRLKRKQQIIWLGVALLLFFSNLWIPELWGKIDKYIAPMITTGGIALLFVFCIENRIASKLLSSPILQFFGKISYGIYLWHMPLIYLYVVLLQPYCSLLCISVLTIGSTILLSWLTFRYVEEPFMRIGKRISNRIVAGKQ